MNYCKNENIIIVVMASIDGICIMSHTFTYLQPLAQSSQFTDDRGAFVKQSDFNHNSDAP